jgi:hypothetical protein
LAALGATITGASTVGGLDHCAVGMKTPKATSATSTDPAVEAVSDHPGISDLPRWLMTGRPCRWYSVLARLA